MDDLEHVLAELQKEIAKLDVPTERIEVMATYRGEPDCTCGVCGEEKQLSETNIVDPDNFEYDEWDTVALHDHHKPFDQQRLCRECEYTFVQNGGTFPKKHYSAFEECPTCYGLGTEHVETEDGISILECPKCRGEGVVEHE